MIIVSSVDSLLYVRCRYHAVSGKLIIWELEKQKPICFVVTTAHNLSIALYLELGLGFMNCQLCLASEYRLYKAALMS